MLGEGSDLPIAVAIEECFDFFKSNLSVCGFAVHPPLVDVFSMLVLVVIVHFLFVCRLVCCFHFQSVKLEDG